MATWPDPRGNEAGQSGLGITSQPPWTSPVSLLSVPAGAERRWPPRRRALPLAVLALALAGVVVSAVGISGQFLPRVFSPAQRQRIMSWEVAKRWRSWPAGQIFPATVGYHLPGSALSGGPGQHLAAHRVGIAGQAPCARAVSPAGLAALAGRGCLALLRATYSDPSQSLAVTVGVAVLPSAAAAARAARSLPAADAGVRGEPFHGTVVARFGGTGRRLAWRRATGPYLVLAAAGYADGRPWLPSAGDRYTQAQLLSLAAGAGTDVASRLGAPPPVPHCPGSPGC